VIFYLKKTLSQKICFRLPNQINIYYAEAFAIFKAISLAISSQLKQVIIFSDCSHVLQDIKHLNINGSPHPTIISQIYNLLHTTKNPNLSLKWISANTDLPQVKQVDLLAKEATHSETITPIEFTYDEAQLLIDNWIGDRWREDWSSNKQCHYQSVFNTPERYVHCHKPRRKETIISRIRLQHTKLNGGLHKLGIHNDGLCVTCKKTENGYHIIMDCIKYKKLNKELQRKISNKENFNYRYILRNPALMEIVADFILEHNIIV
jgi:ribonuclease HI